ncbi:MAG: DinB family protein [Acidobacteria bacterium]|nr:DinB family protein [Acidobacteriota bacterium]
MVRQVALLLVSVSHAQTPELGQGWLPEFNLVSRQLIELAEATPGDKFDWRPNATARSVSEVYVQVVIGNFLLSGRTGAGEPMGLSLLPKNPDQAITSKAEVVRWLRMSQEAVRTLFPRVKPKAKVKLFQQDTTAEAVLLRLLLLNREHYGRAVSYGHMLGVPVR